VRNANTVCLCGSTKYLEDFHEANVQLTRRGFSVITISEALRRDDEQNSGLKKILDLVHLNKILRSDVVAVVGPGYVGESTAREILWADMQGKRIVLLHDLKDAAEGIDYDAAAAWLRNTVTSHTRRACAMAMKVLQ